MVMIICSSIRYLVLIGMSDLQSRRMREKTKVKVRILQGITKNHTARPLIRNTAETMLVKLFIDRMNNVRNIMALY